MAEISSREAVEVLRAYGREVRAGRHQPGLLLAGLQVHGQKMGGFRLDGAILREVEFSSCLIDAMGGEGLRMQDVRFVDSVLYVCNFHDNHWQQVRLEGHSVLGAVSFDKGSLLQDCVFAGRRLEEVSFWGESRCVSTDFRNATLIAFYVGESTMQACDFRGAQCLTRAPGAETGTLECLWLNSHFQGCDFRGANFDEVWASGTTFAGCNFHGCQGKLQTYDKFGDTHFVDCDLSPDFDGSHIVSHQECTDYLLHPEARG